MATDAKTTKHNYQIGPDEDVICPICDAKIKSSEAPDHCLAELELLRTNTTTTTAAAAAAAATTTTDTEAAEAVNESSGGAGSGGRRRPWSVFQRVQRNRQTRQRQRTRQRPAATPAAAPTSSASSTESNCPVCNKNFPQTEIQQHANQCLRQSRRSNGLSNGETHSSDDDEDEEEYEEYEWAGQKRIRVSSLVEGGYSALSLSQTIKYNGSSQQTNEDTDEDLNVDEDDTRIYGPTQYGEADVIPLKVDDADAEDVSEAEVTSYVRSLIASSDVYSKTQNNHSTEATAAAPTAPPATSQMTEAVTAAAAEETVTLSQLPSTSRASRSLNQSHNQIIESLKAKLRVYEKQAQSKLKCLICLDDYKNPAISVSCWHVHCEQCWLQTLGARKLCPQCNSITTPKDLRRIYL